MPNPDKTIDAVIDAVAGAIEWVLPGTVVVRGNQNRVPMPQGNFIALTEMFHEDVETPAYKFHGAQNTVEITQPYRVTIQCDVYGSGACNTASALLAAMNSIVCNDHMPPEMDILYAGDLKQATMVDASDQFLERWNFVIVAQYNPVVTLPQEHADVLVTTLRPV